MKTKILIIPDIHHKVDAVDRIIEAEGADKIIFLGDFFDDFNDHPYDAINTARWIKKSLKQPNRIHCFGNHDISYAFGYINQYVRGCSGYTHPKELAIMDILTRDDWDKFVFAHIEEGWLFTHAGLSSFWYDEKEAGNIHDFIESESKIATKKLYNNEFHWVYGAGVARGGPLACGGILWCDANEEFRSVSNVKQIFGHTPRRGHGKRDKIWIAQDNACLDAHLKYYGVMIDGILKVKKYSDL